jgi:NAD(P)-dependent dehydrogenase (short-subunit alcohol dehydrogenase family)
MQERISLLRRADQYAARDGSGFHRIFSPQLIALGYPHNLNSSSEQRAMETYEQVANAIKALTPLGRTGEPEDIGLIVAFLASDEARWLTGEIIFGSGGLR